MKTQLSESDYKLDDQGIFVDENKKTLGSKQGSTLDSHVFSSYDYQRYFEDLKNIDDKSSLSHSFDFLSNHFPADYLFNVKSANLLRSFKPYFNNYKNLNVLIIGAFSNTSVRYIAQRSRSTTVIDFNYNRLLLAKIRCEKIQDCFFYCSNMVDFIRNSESKYDLIISLGSSDFCSIWLGNIIDKLENVYLSYINQLSKLLHIDGKLMLACDNAQGKKYLLGATDERSIQQYQSLNGYHNAATSTALNWLQWQNVLNNIERSEEKRIEEYYLYPDFRFTKVILGKDYLKSNTQAWQHLEKVHSKDYFLNLNFDKNEFYLTKSLSNQLCLDRFANSFCFIIHNSVNDSAQSPTTPIRENTCYYDFIHAPEFERADEHLNLVVKENKHDKVQRYQLSPLHLISEEAYIEGQLLSLKWLESLIVFRAGDPKLDQFNQCLRDYYHYLLKLEEGLEGGLNIDAIHINVLVDDLGEYKLIDKEWHNKFPCSVELVFYRASWYFINRYLHIVKDYFVNANIRTIKDFLHYCFFQIGVGLNEILLQKYYQQDILFLSKVSGKQASYDLNFDITTISFENFALGKANLKIGYINNDSDLLEQFDVDTPVKYSPMSQVLKFNIKTETATKIKTIDTLEFYPYIKNNDYKQLCFNIESIALIMDADDESKTIWSVKGYDEMLSQYNGSVELIENDKQVLLVPVQRDDYLSFAIEKLDMQDFVSAGNLSVEVKLVYDYSEIYRLARKDFIMLKEKLAFNYQNTSLRDRADVITAIKKISELEDELNAMKSSKIWRLIRIYSDIFKIDNVPKKSFLKKISLIISNFIRIIRS